MRRCFALLRQLKNANVKKRRLLLVNTDLVKAVCECSKNVINGNVSMSEGQRAKICRHRNKIRELAKKRVPLKRKRQIIQSGGFLGALLGPIIGVLSSLFAPK